VPVDTKPSKFSRSIASASYFNICLANPTGFVFDHGSRLTLKLSSDSSIKAASQRVRQRGDSMARSLSIAGFFALAIGLFWIGQGTGVIRRPPSSFMVSQLQWAGYGAVLGAVGLILIWQGNSR
jgi:hypothetical protein